jgi:hypothetical protein
VLAVASAAPSRRPRNTGVAPRVARNAGINGKIISEPTSAKKLVRPSAMTARGNAAVG